MSWSLDIIIHLWTDIQTRSNTVDVGSRSLSMPDTKINFILNKTFFTTKYKEQTLFYPLGSLKQYIYAFFFCTECMGTTYIKTSHILSNTSHTVSSHPALLVASRLRMWVIIRVTSSLHSESYLMGIQSGLTLWFSRYIMAIKPN